MKSFLFLLFSLACLAGCSNLQDMYAAVPPDIPEEARPVWLIRRAIRQGDIETFERLLSRDCQRHARDQGGVSKLFNTVRHQERRNPPDSQTFTVHRSLTPSLANDFHFSETARLKPGYAVVVVHDAHGHGPAITKREGGLWKLGWIHGMDKGSIVEPPDGGDVR